MQARPRGVVGHTREHGPAGKIGARVSDAHRLAHDVGGAEIPLLAAHWLDERHWSWTPHKGGMPFAAGKELAIAVENPGDVPRIETLFEELGKPFRRQAKAQKVRELPSLHYGGGDVVDRPLSRASDNDPGDGGSLALARLAVPW